MTQTTSETTGGGVLLTGAEVMALLRCDRNALYEMRKSGALTFVSLSPRRFRYHDASVRAVMAGKPPRKTRGKNAA